jgi:hypothetical protein
MKKLMLASAAFFCQFLIMGQDLKSNVVPEEKEHDASLVGCWKGSEVNQQIKGVSKYWVSCRMADGTSTLLFIAIDKKGKVTQETENGRWWTENGKYYEFHNYDGAIDTYTYKMTPKGVKFKSVELMGKMNSSYKFIDYKIEED